MWKRLATSFTESLPDDHRTNCPLFWTGHTLTIQVRLDIENNAYLPHAERDCGEIGRLSAHGQAALRKFARHVRQMALG